MIFFRISTYNELVTRNKTDIARSCLPILCKLTKPFRPPENPKIIKNRKMSSKNDPANRCCFFIINQIIKQECIEKTYEN